MTEGKGHEPVTGLRGIILGGGHGWDESGFAAVRPLPLVPVAHLPLICHTLAWLHAAGVETATICTNESWRLPDDALPESIRGAVELTHYVDTAPRGAAGCVRDAAAQFGGERLVVCDGTILPDIDLRAVLAQHQASGAALTVVVSDDQRQVAANGTGRLVPVGVYVVEHAALAHVPATGYQDLKEMLLPKLYAERQPVATFRIGRPCSRVLDLPSYLAMSSAVATRMARAGAAWSGYDRRGMAYVHQAAAVAAEAKLIGAVLIGPRTQIGRDVTIVGPTTIGADCVISEMSVICASVIWDRCRVGARAVVDHAVVTDDAEVPGGRRVDHTLFDFGAEYLELSLQR